METTEQRLKICNFCGEEIPESQRRCPYCGSLLDMGNVVNNYTQQMQINYNNQAAQPPAVDTQKLNGEEVIRAQNGQAQYNQAQYNQASVNQIPEGQMQQQGRAYQDSNRSRQAAAPVQKTMGNGLKVFLTVLFVVIPGIGQLAGVITALLMMNSDSDNDKRSFGAALLVACILVFIMTCSLSFVISMAIPALH